MRLLQTCTLSLFVTLLAAGSAVAACLSLEDQAFGCMAPGCAQASYLKNGKKATHVALIFGNNVYQGDSPFVPALKQAEVDAREMTARLEGQGFLVRCVLNASAFQARREVQDLAEHLSELQLDHVAVPREAAVPAVIYFAGHGMRYKDANYLLFSGVFPQLRYRQELLPFANSVDDLLHPLKNYSKAHPFIIVDACRSIIPLPDDPSMPMVRGNVHSASRTDSLAGFNSGYYVVYSTSENNVASDEGPRFMNYFADEFDSWGRDFSSIVTTTQTLLERNSPTKQTINAFFKTPLADAQWRFTDDRDCDGIQHMLAHFPLVACNGKSSRECLERFEPKPWQCQVWRSQQSSITAAASCRARLVSAFGAKFSAKCEPSNVAGADFRIQDGNRQVRLSGLTNHEVTKVALASDRLGDFVRQSEVKAMSRRSNPDKALNRATEWNDLLVRVPAGTPVTVPSPTASGTARMERAPVVIEPSLSCDTHVCDRKVLSYEVFEPAIAGIPSLPSLRVIEAAAAQPRTADDIVVLRFEGRAVTARGEDLAGLTQMVGQYVAMSGTRIRVTGGFPGPAGTTVEAQKDYERGITRAISRSLKIGDQIALMGLPNSFDAASRLSAGEFTLVEQPATGVEPVFVEFYRPAVKP